MIPSTDNIVIRIRSDPVHQSIEQAKYSEADQIYNGCQEGIIHRKQHKDPRKERERKYKMDPCKDKRHKEHRKHL